MTTIIGIITIIALVALSERLQRRRDGWSSREWRP